jgi:tRNA(fMet)-specific endonuclease VapC
MAPTGGVLLDTNIVIALLGGEEVVVDQVKRVEAGFLTARALGELYYGARQSARAEANLERLRGLAAASAVLSCDAETAARYGN